MGIAGSSRAPVNTMLINPANMVDSRAFVDVNIVAFSVFARNNLAYLNGKSFNFANAKNIQMPEFNRANAPYSVHADVSLRGPSVVFAVRKHSFGLVTGFRSVTDVRGISKELGFSITNGFQYKPMLGVTQHVQKLRATSLNWMETGISYGTILSRRGDMITEFGMTVKRLYGVAGVGVRIDDWTYQVSDSSNLETFNLSGEYAFNDPGTTNPSIVNGKGWGMDMGVMFKVRFKESSEYTPHNPCTDGDYRYRFGFSVLDVGAIKFKAPFYRNKFDETEQNQWNDFNSVTVNDLSGVDSLLNVGLGVSKRTADQTKFKMMLPTGLSAQFDYNLGHGFYCYSMIMGGMPWRNRLGAQRASFLAVVPRWERKRFEVSMPLSLYEFKSPQVGLMFRISSFVVGSDNLGWLLFKQNIYGVDFYMSMKFTLYSHPKCHPKKSKPKVVKRIHASPPPPCPSW
jgi:Family of unknown function (DUF5723)